MSFVRQNSGGERLVQHAVPMPPVPGPTEGMDDLDHDKRNETPFQSQRIDILNDDSPHPHAKKCRQWIKARGTISPAGGHEAHLAALAYMSDSYFVGTIARVHKLWRFSSARKSNTKSSIDEEVLKKLLAMDDKDLRRIKYLDKDDLERIRKLKNGEPSELREAVEAHNREVEEDKPEIGMMVSLDHAIYFHDPRGFRADEWMFAEMETPWADDGRGLVFQKMYSSDGRLIATCVQEVSAINLSLYIYIYPSSSTNISHHL